MNELIVIPVTVTPAILADAEAREQLVGAFRTHIGRVARQVAQRQARAEERNRRLDERLADWDLLADMGYLYAPATSDLGGDQA